jgi:hypothetical protein
MAPQFTATNGPRRPERRCNRAGDHLLAGARFAGDDQRHRRLGDPRQALELVAQRQRQGDQRLVGLAQRLRVGVERIVLLDVDRLAENQEGVTDLDDLAVADQHSRHARPVEGAVPFFEPASSRSQRRPLRVSVAWLADMRESAKQRTRSRPLPVDAGLLAATEEDRSMPARTKRTGASVGRSEVRTRHRTAAEARRGGSTRFAIVVTVPPAGMVPIQATPGRIPRRRKPHAARR